MATDEAWIEDVAHSVAGLTQEPELMTVLVVVVEEEEEGEEEEGEEGEEVVKGAGVSEEQPRMEHSDRKTCSCCLQKVQRRFGLQLTLSHCPKTS